MYAGDAALIARRGETGDVADDAAAERDQRRVAVEMLGDQRIEDQRRALQGLVLLAVRQQAFAEAPTGQGAAQAIQVQRRDDGVADDHEILPRHACRQQSLVLQ